MTRHRLIIGFMLLLGFPAWMSMGCRSVDPRVSALSRIADVFPWSSEAEEFTEDDSSLSSPEVIQAKPVSGRASTADKLTDAEAQIPALVESALANWSVLVDHQRPEQQRAAAWQSYHRDLKELVRLTLVERVSESLRDIQFQTSDGTLKTVRVRRHDFPWREHDFNGFRFAPGQQEVTSKQQDDLARYWQEPGLGIPLVGLRVRDQADAYHGPTVPFAVTAVLRPAASNRIALTSHPSEIAVLHLHNPLVTQRTSFGDADYQLYRDVSAPIASALQGVDRHNFRDFLCPDDESEGVGLRMIEPYQPGKVPVVFVHGLLSDRMTWVDMVNDLRSNKWFNERYQIWAFQYPTGQAFHRSGAGLRRALRAAVHDLDPNGRDPAMSKMVLVGHSMGGLVSKLQVTYGGASLWDSIATLPVADLDAPDEIKDAINEMFYFEPLPFVRRVVFIGTPHRGSDWATSFVGRLGARLIHQPKDRVTALHDLMQANPHVFIAEVHDRLPTSIDLLRPSSPLLQATFELPVSPHVTLHSIIGNGKPLKDSTPADGVVAVANARHPETVSEKMIETTHTHLPDHRETSQEITRILSEHLALISANSES